MQLSVVVLEEGNETRKLRVISTLLFTVLLAKSDSDLMFWLLGYQGLRIDRSLVY